MPLFIVMPALEPPAWLASPCNMFAKALSDVEALAKIKAGARIKVMIPRGG
jgi:hypothetical protein